MRTLRRLSLQRLDASQSRRGCSEHLLRLPFGYMLLGTLLFYLACAPALRAQAFGDWEEGTIVLVTGDTLSGRLFINQESDLVEIEVNSAIKTYTALQVLLARFYDPPRLFASHAAALRGTMEVPSFFEVLYPGPHATLLSRNRLGMNAPPVVDQYGQVVGTFYNGGIKRDFFVLNARGRVKRLAIRRPDLARSLEANPPDDLIAYIKHHKPDPDSVEDLIGLIGFFNHLKSGEPGVK